MGNGEIELKTSKTKTFKEKKITAFLDEYANNDFAFTGDRIKLCSSDDFTELSDEYKKILRNKKSPTMISQVGGFYVMASLAGYATYHSRTKPVLLFFDKKINNIANAIYNTLLMQACDNKERYVTVLFGFDDVDIIKSLDEKKYEDYIMQEFNKRNPSADIQASRKKVHALREYKKNRQAYDENIAKDHDLPHRAMRTLEEKYNIANIKKYAEKHKKYDKEKHLELLHKAVDGKLSNEHMGLFESIVGNMTDYLAKDSNYQDLVQYLSTDMLKNGDNHILCNNWIYQGYKSMIYKKGQSAVKFVPGIDISTEEGLAKLINLLKNEKIITDDINTNKFPIDIAFLPHVETLQEAYPFIKNNVERYIRVNRGSTNNFTMHSTAILNVRTYDSIGAKFIDDARKNRKPLKNLVPIEKEKNGFPLITFMAGVNYGNIYSSEEDVENVISMAIADKVDTIYISGLIYSTYYHNQTNRRMLIDPKYETLDQRLKAAKKLVKRINEAGIKVVYKMGDEEYHLYEDMFKIYTKEQGVTGNNFLRRDDLKSSFDWVRPIIIEQLIPYLIRSGEDLTNFYTDEEQETRVSELCHALKNYSEGLPLGELSKYIKPQYLQDTDMFRVVYSTIDQYSDDDPNIAINMMSNPNFSTNAQYANPTAGVIKKLKIHQTDYLKGNIVLPQWYVDSRPGDMSISYSGDQSYMTVPQMINDGLYINNPDLLPGIKEHVTSDPTHARVTKGCNRPNYPGSWTITGDIREKMTIVPYWQRSREVMEYVNKTGKGFDEIDVFYLNDIQVGSLTERLEYTLKAIDHFYYDYPAPKGIFGNGDFQHGWNYKSFANESRFLGTMSVTQQMENVINLFKPWFRKSFGVIQQDIFKGEYGDYKIDKETSKKILNHLAEIDAIKMEAGIDKTYNLIKDGVDYKTLDLKLPPEFAPYEQLIREKLDDIKIFKFFHAVEGNHEYNSDYEKKGVNLLRFGMQKLKDYSNITGADIEIIQNEFVVNGRGDIIQAPLSCKTINGYNIVNTHLYKLAKGGTPTQGMARQIIRMGDLSRNIHIANMAHLHIFEVSVIDNKLYNITGSGAGQSGFEQNYGLASKPLFEIHRFMPDGRFVINTIGTEFLKDYKIQNPEVKAIGLDNFIRKCLEEEAGIYAFGDEPKDIQKVYQRQLVIGKPPRVIGTKVD